MSCHASATSVEGCTQASDGYAFIEDARDATRYVQRIAVLRQALYHGTKADIDSTLWPDMLNCSVGERF